MRRCPHCNEPLSIRRYLRQREVLAITGWSKSTLRRREMEGKFPKRVQTSPGIPGWREDLVEAALDQMGEREAAPASESNDAQQVQPEQAETTVSR